MKSILYNDIILTLKVKIPISESPKDKLQDVFDHDVEHDFATPQYEEDLRFLLLNWMQMEKP